jgi:hypothetical protein
MKYKINYKSLDNNKEQALNKIKDFLKDKYDLEEHKGIDDSTTVFLWKEYQPGFGTNGSEHILAVDWDEYTIYMLKNSQYDPFSNKELEFFDMLGFELEPSFADYLDQNIYDWTDN